MFQPALVIFSCLWTQADPRACRQPSHTGGTRHTTAVPVLLELFEHPDAKRNVITFEVQDELSAFEDVDTQREALQARSDVLAAENAALILQLQSVSAALLRPVYRSRKHFWAAYILQGDLDHK